jgi:RNA polymerase sigma factor (sigma-70 family)
MKWYLVERIDRCHTEHEPMPPNVTGEGRSATMSHPQHAIRVPSMTTPHSDDDTTRHWLVEEFERQRGHLRAVGYRMLGSVSEADDAVQEAWLRLDRGDPGGTDDLRGWLTVVVGRICLDALRRRKSRREQHAGSWLPDPIIRMADDAGPERDTVMADSVGLALLVVMESLTPAERLSLVLHDVFGVPFEEIAPVVERSPAAARQLASRARRRVLAEAPEPDADLAVQRRVVNAFLAAARDGDFEGLLRVLDPNVVLRVDGGPNAPRAFSRPPLVGAEAVAGQAENFRRGAGAKAEPVIVNGAVGMLVRFPARSIVAAFTVTNGRIAAIDFIADPDKLGRLGLA